MHAERPERVLVGADPAEVLAVRVDAEHVAEVACVDQPLHLLDRGVVEQQVAGHQHAVGALGGRDEVLGLGRVHRRRLLDQHVLAGLERALGQLVVRGRGRGDDDRVELVVGQHLVEVRRRPRARIAGGEALERVGRGVAEPAQVGEVVEVPREVRAPVAEAGEGDLGHNFQTFPSTRPFLPVALRKSTTSFESSTRRS